MPNNCRSCQEKSSRREAIVQLGLGGFGLGMVPGLLSAQTDPKSAPPQEGDLLVGVSDAAMKPVRPEDIKVGAPPVRVWPLQSAGNVARSENRLNELLLIRLDPATLNATMKAASADGVLGFSALCTHAGCTITDWIPSRSVLACDCHSSEFDPREAGKMVDGPAAHPLPSLSLKVVNGTLAVAKPFAVAIRFDE